MILLGQWQEPDAQGRPHTVRKYWFPSQADQAVFLRQLVEAYRQLQVLRNLAVWIVFDAYGCAPKALASHATAIADWVQKRILYVNELPETFSTPIRTLLNRYEDCDGHAVLVATLCEAIGIPTQLVLLEWAGGYRHIFPRALVKLGGKMAALPLDTTLNQPVSRATNPITLALRKHGPNVRILVV